VSVYADKRDRKGGKNRERVIYMHAILHSSLCYVTLNCAMTHSYICAMTHLHACHITHLLMFLYLFTRNSLESWLESVFARICAMINPFVLCKNKYKHSKKKIELFLSAIRSNLCHVLCSKKT